MVHKDVVNLIWPVLEKAKLAFIEEFGSKPTTIGQMVDFCIDWVWQHQPQGAAGLLCKQQIMEAWLYQALMQVAELQDVQPLPPGGG